MCVGVQHAVDKDFWHDATVNANNFIDELHKVKGDNVKDVARPFHGAPFSDNKEYFKPCIAVKVLSEQLAEANATIVRLQEEQIALIKEGNAHRDKLVDAQQDCISAMASSIKVCPAHSDVRRVSVMRAHIRT